MTNPSLLGGYANELPAALLSLAGTPGTVAAAVAAYVTKAETQSNGPFRQTVLTLTNLPQAVVNGTEYQGTEIFDFPEGHIRVMDVWGVLQQKTTSAILSTLNGAAVGAVALGTAAASNVALTSTMADLMPTTAFASSAVINVAGTAVIGILVAGAHFDGHLAAKKMYLNSGYATTGDVDADATQTWSGTITITWCFCGDH